MPESNETELRKTIVGKHRPDNPWEQPKDLMLGFGLALKNALADAKEKLVDEDVEQKTFQASIRFEAQVTVRNPGAIDEYRAFLTEEP